MKLPRPPSTYTVTYESQRNLLLEMDSNANLKRNRDLEVGEGRLILTAPDGSRHALIVSNAGALSTVVV